MDNTELHYLAYDPDEIMAEMMQAYVDAGGSVIRAGDEKEMLLRAVQNTFVLSFAGIDNALRMATLRYAMGEYLDIKGEDRDCYRIEATPAHAVITITTGATGEAVTIPAGSIVTQDGMILYTTDEDILLPGTAGTLTANITAEQPGTKGNSLLANAQMQFILPFNGVTDVICSTAASGGQDREEDETYRNRIREYGLTIITTGPAEQYERVAMAVSSQIIDAKALNGGDGVADVYLLPASNDGTAALIAAVEAALSPDDTRPLTDYVNVSLATKKEYDLKINYSVYTGQNVSAAISAAVNEYKDWQNKTIGRAFNPDKLKALLYQAGCNYVEIDATSSFDGGTAEYTEIEPNEYCDGTITLAVIST